MSERRPQVVIVGAGFGGLEVARRLSKVDVDVTIIDRNNYHLFQPLAYQVATAALSDDTVATPIRSLVNARRGSLRVVLGEVCALDPSSKSVRLRAGGRVDYDYLVLAAGARTSYFGNEEWRRHAQDIKTLPGCLRARDRLLDAMERAELEWDPARRRELLRVAIVGGGPTGIELAGAVRELTASVARDEMRSVEPEEVSITLIEAMDDLVAMFEPPLRRRAKEMLEELGVEVRTGTKVSGVDERGVVFESGERLDAPTVIWASGVEPVPLARTVASALDASTRGGAIAVTPECTVPGLCRVFCIGDMAHCRPPGVGAPLPRLAPVAVQQGQHVARCIRADRKGRRRPTFRYRDRGIMATIGRHRGIVQAGPLRLAGPLGWFAWLTLHLMFLAGGRNRATAVVDWVWSYLSRTRAARLLRPHELSTWTHVRERSHVLCSLDADEDDAGAQRAAVAALPVDFERLPRIVRRARERAPRSFASHWALVRHAEQRLAEDLPVR